MIATVRASEIGGHGFAQRGRHIQEVFFARDAPGRKQAADGHSAIEEIGECGRVELKWHRTRRAVPCRAGQESRRPYRGFQIGSLFRHGMQVHERTHGVAGNLRRNRVVAPHIGAIIARHGAARFLDAGPGKPLPGT